jgi:porin
MLSGRYASPRRIGLGILSALAFFAGGALAHAADPGAADTAANPGASTEPAGAEPETEERLLGDLGGPRPVLGRFGINLSLSYIGETFGVVRGGVKRGAIYEGQAGLGVGIDLAKMIGWTGAKAYANALQIHGRGASDRLLGGNLMTVSNIEAFPTTRLYRLWFEQSLFDDRASVRFGQIAADDEFITSETAGGLINGTFGWPLLTAADVRGGGPAYPLPQPGVRLQVKPAAGFTLRSAAFSDNPGGRNCATDPQECDPHGIKFAFSGGTFWLAELEYAANSGKEAAGLPGVYKLGGWHETGTFPDQFTGALDRGGNWGVYAVADQAIWRRPDKNEQGVNFFLRIGGAPSDRNLISWYADAGLGFKAPFPERPKDVLTLGAAYGKISPDAARAVRFALTPTPVRDHEAVIELSYIAALLPGWTVQPDLQYIIHPGGNVANPAGTGTVADAVVLGLRTTLAF